MHSYLYSVAIYVRTVSDKKYTLHVMLRKPYGYITYTNKIIIIKQIYTKHTHNALPY